MTSLIRTILFCIFSLTLGCSDAFDQPFHLFAFPFAYSDRVHPFFEITLFILISSSSPSDSSSQSPSNLFQSALSRSNRFSDSSLWVSVSILSRHVISDTRRWNFLQPVIFSCSTITEPQGRQSSSTPSISFISSSTYASYAFRSGVFQR